MSKKDILNLPKGTKLVPNGKVKSSNYLDLRKLEEVEIVKPGRGNRIGWGFPFPTLKVKILKGSVHKKYISIWQQSHAYKLNPKETSKKNDIIYINPNHFKAKDNNEENLYIIY